MTIPSPLHRFSLRLEVRKSFLPLSSRGILPILGWTRAAHATLPDEPEMKLHEFACAPPKCDRLMRERIKAATIFQATEGT